MKVTPAENNRRVAAKVKSVQSAWAAYSSVRSKLPPGHWKRLAPIAARQFLRSGGYLTVGERSAPAGPEPILQKRFGDADVALFSKLRGIGYSPATIYDIGASDSCWSVTISPIFAQASFHLFEPLALTLEDYRYRMHHTLETHPQFRLHLIALASENGTRQMSVYHNPANSTLLNIPPGDFLQTVLPVECWRLDDYVRDHQLPQANVVKIDVQGLELEILQGAVETISRADILVLETWLYRGYGARTPLLNELVDFLWPLQFLLTDFGDLYLEERHWLCSIDAFFMSIRFLDDIKSASRNWDW